MPYRINTILEGFDITSCKDNGHQTYIDMFENIIMNKF